MLKFTDNPPLTPAGLASLKELEGEWFVGHTKSRNEKIFAWELIRREIPHFLPMAEKITFSGGRKRRQMAPVFPGYVFFCGDSESRSTAMTTGRLCQVIPVTDRPVFVDEIAQVEAACRGAGAGDLEFFPHLAVGRQVRVTGGPQEGLVGTVVEHQPAVNDADGNPRALVVLRVSILGTGAAVRVPPSLLVEHTEKFFGTPKLAPKYQLVDPPPRRSGKT
jgi:hypothetical protein